MALTPRGQALRWLTNHRGIVEDPFGSNSDHRKDGISAAQHALGLGPGPWCGTWFAAALRAAGVKGVSWRQASVEHCEDDARAHLKPFRGYVTTADPKWSKKVLRGDGVILFGRGVHIGTVRSTAWAYRKLGLIRTEEGNTSNGAGSQFNGGGAYTRYRRIADVHGFCLVDYPG